MTVEASRRAALLLHAMDAGDQEWTLANLAPAQRAHLEPLLRELRAIGIPPDAALLEGPPQDPAPQPPRPAHARLAQAPRLELDALARALEHEPPRLVALLLQAGEAGWQRQLQSRFQGRSRAHAGRPAAGTAPPALQRALQEATVNWLEQVAAAPPARGAARWHALLRRLPRWGAA